MNQAAGVAAGIGLLMLALYMVAMLLVLLNMVFTVTTLIQAARSDSHDKLMWVLIILLLPLFGWIIYRATQRPIQTPRVSYGNFTMPPPMGAHTSKTPNVQHKQAQEDIVRSANATRDALDELVRKRRAVQ